MREHETERRYCIAVADDEPAIREFVGEMLSANGYRVKLAANAEEALQTMANGDIVDVLLTDVSMPGVDGFELVKQVTEQYPDTSPIVMTGFASLAGARKATREGVFDYLPKPFTELDLLVAVETAIERQSRSRKRSRQRELEDLFQLSNDLREARDTWEMLRITTTTAMLQTKSATGCLAELREGRLWAFPVGDVGVVESQRPLGCDDIISKCTEQQIPLLLSDNTREDNETIPFLRVTGQTILGAVSEALIVPLISERRSLGALAVGRFLGSEPYNRADMQIMSVLGAQCGLLLSNAALIESLQQAYIATVNVMARAVEARDPYTRGHSARVADICMQLAQALKLNPHDMETLQLAADLHDIGKLAVPEGILNKPGRLSEEEWQAVRLHPMIGAEVLAPAGFLQEVVPLVMSHHERYDGAGYPSGLKHPQLPELAHIIIAADAWDAMTSDRPYRPALDIKTALDELQRGSGGQFAPDVVDAATQIFSKKL